MLVFSPGLESNRIRLWLPETSRRFLRPDVIDTAPDSELDNMF